MEMNFPHKDLEWTAADEANDVSTQFADHRAFFAGVIARQASSQSAKDFVAAQQAPRAVQTSSFEDRMAFFAGRTSPEETSPKKVILFRTGCFRPDLAKQDMTRIHE